MTRLLRVLHAPTAVGGHPGGLARAERDLGLDSVAVSLLEPRFGYVVDEVLARAGDGPALRAVHRARLLLRLRRFDVVHFNYGSTLLPVPIGRTGLIGVLASALALRDLPTLRTLGKRIVVTFQGDDARQATVGGSLVNATPEHYTAELDAARRRTIAAFDRYADAIFFLNPDLAQVLPARAVFLPYASVDPAEWEVQPEDPDGPPLVVHAPSDPRVKGTDLIKTAVTRLQAEGVPLRFELVQGVDRGAVRRVLERAAIVIDQLYAGWYGGLAVEAMAVGKPVLAALDGLNFACVPAELRSDLPVVDVTVETLADRLRELIASPEERRRLGLSGRAFVERWHDPRTVARIVVASYVP